MLECSHCGWPVVNINGQDVHQITGTTSCPEKVWWRNPSDYFAGATLDARTPPPIPPFVFSVRPVPNLHYMHEGCAVKHRTVATVESCPRWKPESNSISRIEG